MLPSFVFRSVSRFGHFRRLGSAVRHPVIVVVRPFSRLCCPITSPTCLSPVYLPSRDCVNAPPIGVAANPRCTDYLVHRSLLGVAMMLFGVSRLTLKVFQRSSRPP